VGLSPVLSESAPGPSFSGPPVALQLQRVQPTPGPAFLGRMLPLQLTCAAHDEFLLAVPGRGNFNRSAFS